MRPILLLLAACPLVFGQVDLDALVITVSHQVSFVPDELVFSVSVFSSDSARLDEIVAALQPLGITAADFSSLYSATPELAAQLRWQFTLRSPLSKLKTTVASLNALQSDLVKKGSGLSLNYGVAGAQVSKQQQDSQPCPTPDLVSAAQVQAQKLADAAGLVAGPILAISDGNANGGFAVPTAAFRAGDFVLPSSIGVITNQPILGLSPVLTFAPPVSSTAACSVVVKFKLLRYQ